MRHAGSRAARLAAAAALAVFAVLLGAAPAAAQPQSLRRAVTRVVDALNTQLARAISDETAGDTADAPPRTLRRCGALYDRDVRRLAEGPELLRSHDRWIIQSFGVIQRYGGMPLPICFEWKSDSVFTPTAQYLLDVNNTFMKNRFAAPPGSAIERLYWNGYVLTGHTDPDEADTAVARGRAETIQAQSPGPSCRFVVRVGPREIPQSEYRKVTYSYQPAVRSCPRAPH